MSAETQRPSFDFFAGVARQYAAARPEGAGSGRVPLSPLETGFFLSLIAVLTLGVAALILHQARFVTFRVAVEDRERALPYLLGQAIRERDRVVGVSFQQVFQMARVEPVAPVVPEDDGMFANAPAGDEVRAVPLQRAGTVRRGRSSD
jgi:hypothetical protein